MRETIQHILIIGLITGTVFFTNLGQSRLWDRDEPRNAGCAAEMMARGDWVVPTFNDELRHQKPVLLYWLVMSAYSVLGVNEFSARFWSAALAIGTTLATYVIARRLVNARVGLLAAIALGTSLMFDVAARAVTPDSVLIFCGTVAMMFYVVGTFRKDESGNLVGCNNWFPQNAMIQIGMFAMLGLGVLAKGPVGFLLPMAMIGMFRLIMLLPERQDFVPPKNRYERCQVFVENLLRPFYPRHFLKTLWSMNPILASSVVLLVAAPWYLLVDSRTNGDFTQMFFVGEHFQRATVAMEDHRGGFWFYPLAILVGFFPWSVFWGPIAVSFFKKSRTNSLGPVTILMLCWVGVQVVAFSLVQTKLPSYVTPCYPALAILTAFYLNEFSAEFSKVSLPWFAAAVGGLILAGGLIVGGIGYASQQFMPDQLWIAYTGLIPIATGIVILGMVAFHRRRNAPLVFALGAILFCWTLFGFGTKSLDREQESHLILSEIKARPELPVASFGRLESSWVFYGDRPILELALEDQLPNPESQREFWERKRALSVGQFTTINPESLIITTEADLGAIKNQLPEDFGVIQTADYFLKNKRLVLVGRVRNQTASTRVLEPIAEKHR